MFTGRISLSKNFKDLNINGLLYNLAKKIPVMIHKVPTKIYNWAPHIMDLAKIFKVPNILVFLQITLMARGGGGGTPLYGLYRNINVRPQRVWFFSRFGHK